MPSEAEVKVAAAVLRRRADLSEDEQSFVDDAREALSAAEIEREAERRRNCTHPNKRGNGTIGTDGSSKWDWYCLDCHASGHQESLPRHTIAGPVLFG